MDWSPYYPTYFARTRGLPEPIDITTDPYGGVGAEAVALKTGIVDIGAEAAAKEDRDCGYS